MTSYIEFLQEHIGLSGMIATGVILIFFVLQIIGELLEFKGKVVPEVLKVRKFLQRRKNEKKESQKTIQDVKNLLNEIGKHYSDDNITRRDAWMNHINERIGTYDHSIGDIKENLTGVAEALKANTRMTEEMFVQNCRDRILDFAEKVSNENTIVSREEFSRIFKVHKEYEDFLSAHNMTNGEIEIAYRMINDAYAIRLKTSSFIEDIRGYIK